MKVRDVMTRHIASVGPNNTLEDAAVRMNDSNVGALPVVSSGGLVGILTDRDIVTRGICTGGQPASTPISAVMSTSTVQVSPESSLSEAAHLMARHQVRRLPVVDGNNLVGMISLGDISIYTNGRTAGNALQDISLPG